MKKLRWAMDGEFWDADISTPITLHGVSRPVPGDPLPLGLSRGVRLSRPKQIDFFQRFMSMPFVPSFTPHAFSLQRVLSIPLGERWFATLLGQFNLQNFINCVKKDKSTQSSEISWMETIGRNLQNKSFYALDFSSEVLITPDDTLLLSVEANADQQISRKKAVFQHKFTNHNLTVEAAWPGLFTDYHGTYWDVPFTMAVDLASVASDAGPSYHMFINHNAGSPKQFEGQSTNEVAPTLLPGLNATGAFSFKKNIDIWRSRAPKLKLVQPYDMFLSNPHISTSGTLGSVVTASLGDNSLRALVKDELPGFNDFRLRARGENSAVLADIFASVSLSAQHGNFQRLFLDLTRFYTRLDFPSGSKFLSGATRLVNDLSNSRPPSLEAVQAICPNATLSLQQQVQGLPIRKDVRPLATLIELDNDSPTRGDSCREAPSAPQTFDEDDQGSSNQVTERDNPSTGDFANVDSPPQYCMAFVRNPPEDLSAKHRVILEQIAQNHPETFTRECLLDCTWVMLPTLLSLAGVISGIISIAPAELSSQMVDRNITFVNQLVQRLDFNLQWLLEGLRSLDHPQLKNLREIYHKRFEVGADERELQTKLQAALEEIAKRTSDANEDLRLVRQQKDDITLLWNASKQCEAESIQVIQDFRREAPTLPERFFHATNLSFLLD